MYSLDQVDSSSFFSASSAACCFSNTLSTWDTENRLHTSLYRGVHFKVSVILKLPQKMMPRALTYKRFTSHGFILHRFDLKLLYPMWVSSPMALSFVGFILHHFILCGFPLPWFYPTWVCSHTALSYVGFLSQAFILCGFHYTLLYPTGVSSHWALFYVGCLWWLYPMWVSSPCLYLMNVSSPRALSLWVLSPKAFILCGCHPIQQGYISTWSFPFLHNNFGTLISEELTSTKRLQVKQTERQSNSKCG